MYNERIKNNTIKYLNEHRESLRLNLPKGTKVIWKAYAERKGISVTELLTRLITDDMEKNGFIWKDNSEQDKYVA